MDFNKKKFLVDFLIFICFLIVAVSGFILWDNESMGRGVLLGVHAWVSVVLVVLILVHLFLNWNWVKAMFRQVFGKREVQ